MTHFGIICPAAIGHLNPMCVLGRELQRRGHKVTLFGIPDVQPKVMRSGLNFWTIGEAESPLGTLEQNHKRLGELSGLAGLKFTIHLLQQEAALLFAEAPTALKIAGVEALLVDQISVGGTIADFLNLPFITVCNAMLINREAGVPPYFSHWSYNKAVWAKLRNKLGNFFIEKLTQPMRNTIVQQRQQWQLPTFSTRDDTDSQLAQICQLPAEYDFPRVSLSRCFHYTGPLQDLSGLEPVSFSSSSISFPFEKLTEKPLIYASLGTLQNRKAEIFQKIAEACVGLDAQLVISLGNPDLEAELKLPGAPLVVSYAPHQQLIERASLIITHAGMNTVLGALSSGVPLVAIPITNEQPGIAARLARTAAGKVIPLASLSVSKLREVIQQVLTEDSYKQNAIRLQTAIRQAGRVTKAANIIEQAISTRKPVFSDIN
jgi:zeaxanthin glucosyltransferase